MNKKNTLLLAMSAMLTAATMQAAPVAHNSDNIYAGFWQVNDDNVVARNYVAAIGSRSTFASQTSRTVLADLGSDLDTVFGSGWYGASTDTSKVYWGVFSWNSASASTNYFTGLNETANSSAISNPSGTIPENVQAGLGTANSGYGGFTSAYTSSSLEIWNNTAGTGALSVGVGMTDVANSFANKVDLPTPWGVGGLVSSRLQAWVGDQDNGGNAGDQWIWAVTKRLNGSDNVNNSSFLNQLTVESNGKVLVIPEPSTYALFGFGLLLMVVAYRRKVSA
jgi:hypothetical protein